MRGLHCPAQTAKKIERKHRICSSVAVTFNKEQKLKSKLQTPSYVEIIDMDISDICTVLVPPFNRFSLC